MIWSCPVHFLFLFFYLCARLGCVMKKCQKVWFPWQKPSTYGRLLETFHMVLKEKNWLRFSTFFCKPTPPPPSVRPSLCSSWVWRILSHDCWGEGFFFCFFDLQCSATINDNSNYNINKNNSTRNPQVISGFMSHVIIINTSTGASCQPSNPLSNRFNDRFCWRRPKRRRFPPSLLLASELRSGRSRWQHPCIPE